MKVLNIIFWIGTVVFFGWFLWLIGESIGLAAMYEDDSDNKESENGSECEWQYDIPDKTSGLSTSCGRSHYRQDELEDFTYCPYCGRKIKLVDDEVVQD